MPIDSWHGGSSLCRKGSRGGSRNVRVMTEEGICRVRGHGFACITAATANERATPSHIGRNSERCFPHRLIDR
eukprot:scaffold178693_cov40-Tisochrysis_lutea.AAC.2